MAFQRKDTVTVKTPETLLKGIVFLFIGIVVWAATLSLILQGKLEYWYFNLPALLLIVDGIIQLYLHKKGIGKVKTI